ncbi:hypothetical protein MBR110_30335 (plasmid) [Burkholderia sp. MBR-1]|nr:hypothetical protein MBR110_30335 [Burkholderia sp. MBR-1]
MGRPSGKTLAFVVVIVFVALCAGAAIAGTDTTFNSVATMIQGWLTGSLGQVLALAGFAIALASGLVRGSAVGVVFGLALALAATYGPTILTGLFTATI